MHWLKRIRLFGRKHAGVWSMIYRRRQGEAMHWSSVVRGLLSLLRSILLHVSILFIFTLGFVAPPIFFESSGRLLIGGLIDGRIVAALSIAVAFATMMRFGFATSGNVRVSRAYLPFGILISFAKAAGAGIAIGSIALISQSPTEISAIIVSDDYDNNGDQHGAEFVWHYIQQLDELKQAGLSIRHATPDVGMLIEDAYSIGVREKADISNGLAMSVMAAMETEKRRWQSNGIIHQPTATEQLSSLKEAEGNLVGSIETRLKAVRQYLSDRRGDRVVVISAHRLPPNSPSMQSCWPMPDSISALWVCANPHAENTAKVEETRLLSVWVSSDPLVRPIVRVTAEVPTAVTDTQLNFELLNVDGTQKESKTFPAPLPGTESNDFLPGTYEDDNGRRVAWQFPLLRYSQEQMLKIELSANGTVTHPWRTPPKLHPNQLRIKADEQALAILTALPDFEKPDFPFVIDPNCTPGEPGCIQSVVGPLDPNSPPTVPTLELIPSNDSASASGDVKLLPPYINSDLGPVTITPGLTKDWPDLSSSSSLSFEELFAELTLPGAASSPVLYRRVKSNGGWLTIHMPSVALLASNVVTSDVQRGHRHLVFFAASLVERNGKSRPGWHQLYKIPENANALPVSSGLGLDDDTLLQELLAAMVNGNNSSEIKETPSNTAMHGIAPAVPLGTSIALAVSSIASLILVIYVRRCHSPEST